MYSLQWKRSQVEVHVCMRRPKGERRHLAQFLSTLLPEAGFLTEPVAGRFG